MRILATADLHGDLGLYQWLVDVAMSHRPDVLVMAGDLFGFRDDCDSVEQAQRLDALDLLELLGPLHVPTYYIMGNDDAIELDSSLSHVQSIHRRCLEVNGWRFVGYQYSLPFAGGLYEKPEESIAADLESISPLVDPNTVLVTHNPAYGILDVGMTDCHAGSPSILKLVQERRPRVHIHGHIHERFGVSGIHFNVAAAGVKRAVLIDLEPMAHTVVTGS